MKKEFKNSLSLALSAVILTGTTSAFAADEMLSDSQKEQVKQRVEGLSKFLQNRRMIGSVVKANKANKAITDEKIQELDKKWRAGTDADWISALMTNPCAKSLSGYMKRNPEFGEIFITNVNGLNVCQTGRTSDYYQADEGWWQKAYNDGKGGVVFGKVKYDESVGKKAVAVSMPIVNPVSKKVIGVAKAVVDLSVLK